MSRLFDRAQFESTPVLVPNVAYTSGDQIGGINKLSGFCPENKSTIVLENILILDKDKQNSAMDVFFFNTLPVLTSVDNTAFAMTSAEALKVIGVMKVLAADYSTSAAQAWASVALSRLLTPLDKTKDIYYVLVARGTPTYTTASALVLKFAENRP